MKPLRVDVRVRNNCLVRRREELGLGARAFAQACGVGYQAYLGLESMRSSPLVRHSQPADKQWKALARRIAAFHGVGPSELWPEAVLNVQRTRASAEVDPEELQTLGAVARTPLELPDDVVLARERHDAVHAALERLSDQEAHVLRARFGLGDDIERTLDDVGEDFGVTRERIRQIEGAALRKLRHPRIGVQLGHHSRVRALDPDRDLPAGDRGCVEVAQAPRGLFPCSRLYIVGANEPPSAAVMVVKVTPPTGVGDPLVRPQGEVLAMGDRRRPVARLAVQRRGRGVGQPLYFYDGAQVRFERPLRGGDRIRLDILGAGRDAVLHVTLGATRAEMVFRETT